MYGHGQISNKAYYQILSSCGPDPIQTLLHGPLPPPCQTLVNAAFASVGNYYGYGLYDDCNFEPNPWGPGPFEALPPPPPPAARPGAAASRRRTRAAAAAAAVVLLLPPSTFLVLRVFTAPVLRCPFGLIERMSER